MRYPQVAIALLLGWVALAGSARAEVAGAANPRCIHGQITLNCEPLPGVTLSFSGGIPSATTDESGWYEVGVPDSSVEVTVTPRREGMQFQPAQRSVLLSGGDADASFTATAASAGATPAPQPAGAAPLSRAVTADAYEPDDTASAAKSISAGQTQNRTIHAAANLDWAKFTLSARGAVRIETDGLAGDTQMYLYGPNSSSTLVEEDDDDGNGNFSMITRTLDAGTYYVKVQEYGNNGTINAYTLSFFGRGEVCDLEVSNLTFAPVTLRPGYHPTAVQWRLDNNGPADLVGDATPYECVFFLSRNTTAGDSDDVRIGAASGSVQLAAGLYDTHWLNESGLPLVTIPAGTSGDYYVVVRVRHKSPSTLTDSSPSNDYARTSTTVTVDAAISADSFEPDDTAGTAKVITGGQTQNRSIHAIGNTDWAKFTLSAKSEVRIETAGAAGDTVLSLYGPNSSSALVELNDDDGAGDFSLIARTGANALAAGTYYIKVEEYNNNDVIVAYTLNLTVTPTTAAGDTYEPDDTAAAAKVITNGQTQSRSIHAAGNTDWAKFTLSAKSAVRVETAGSAGDTILYLYGPNSSSTLVASDNDSGAGAFSLITRSGTAALAAGTYYIKVQENGNNATIAAYTLKLTVTPVTQADLAASNLTFAPTTIQRGAHPTSVGWTVTNNGPAALTGSATPYECTFYLSRNTTMGDTDDILIGTTSSALALASAGSSSGVLAASGLALITIPTSASGSYYVVLRVQHKSPSTLTDPVATNNYARTTATITVPTPITADTYEVDDTAAAAKVITNGQTQSRSIHAAANTDWAKFALSAKSEVRVETAGTAGDTMLYLYGPNSSSTLVASDNDNGTGAFSLVTRAGTAALAAGTYYIKVQENGNNATIAAYTLKLTVTPVATGDTFEPDDTAAAAKAIANGQTQSRSIHAVANTDWAKFTLAAKSEVRVETAGAAGDTMLTLYGPNSSSTLVASDNDSGAGAFSLITRAGTAALAAGTYYIKVQENGNNATIAAYTLRLTVTPATSQNQADLTVSDLVFAPTSIQPGAHPTSVTYTVTNNGPAALTGSATPYGYTYYLSRNSTMGDSDDINIGSASSSLELPAGTSDPRYLNDSGRALLTIPASASGSYYVVMRVQHQSPSPMTDPVATNNYTRTTTTISVASAPVPTKLAFTQQPTGVAASAAFTVKVSIQDSASHTVTTATNAVTIALTSNTTGATLSGTKTRNAVAGVATFTGLTVNKAGTYRLQATATGLTAATSALFTVTAVTQTATKLVFLTTVPTWIAGSKMPQVQVAAQTAAGQTATAWNTPVTMSLVATGPTAGQLLGTLVVTPVNGVATFSNLTIYRSGIFPSGYTLRATSGSLTAGTSVEFLVGGSAQP